MDHLSGQRVACKLVSLNENRTVIQSEQGRSSVLPLLDNYGSSEDEDDPSSDTPVVESGESKDIAAISPGFISKSESVLSENLTADEELLSSADIRRFLLRHFDQTNHYGIPERPMDKSVDPGLEV